MGYALRKVGPVTIHALADGEGPFFDPLHVAFPGQPPEATWRAAEALDPGAFSPSGWWLRFRCFALRLSDDSVVLVDAGIGPAGSPASAWAPVPGHLPERLAHAGISPAEIDTVVITHLHTDHIGWAVTDGSPYFPNARYLLQRTEADALGPDSRLRELLIRPLGDQLTLIEGGQTLAPGLRIVPTPGHTPGHQSLILDQSGETVAITGDLLVHAVQLIDTAVGYAHDTDPAMARASREAFLRDLPPGAVLATPHLTEPFIAAR